MTGNIGLLRSLRTRARRSVFLVCLYHLLADWRAGGRLRRGKIESNSGKRHASLDLDESVRHVRRTYESYLQYAGWERFSGVVAEIGAGDNYGVALLALRDGVQEYHVVDRFQPDRDQGQQNEIYRHLAVQYSLDDLFDGAPSENNIRRLKRHLGEPAETFFRSCDGVFDTIMSIAVLEHLYDPLGALADMFSRLGSNGILVHRVDLRDHGMFSNYHHPLTFLTLGSGLYRRMSRNRGRPNRVRIAGYRACLEGLAAAETSVRITRLVGEDDDFPPSTWNELPAEARARAVDRVRSIRARLAVPFRGMSDEDLAVSGCLLYARRR